MIVGEESERGAVTVRSKPGPFAGKENAKSPAPSRVEIVKELNAGAARDDRPPGTASENTNERSPALPSTGCSGRQDDDNEPGTLERYVSGGYRHTLLFS